jgi:integrase
MRIEKQFWDSEQQQAISRGKNKYPGAPELNAFLHRFKDEIRKVYQQNCFKDGKLPYDELKRIIISHFKEETVNFFEIFDSFLLVKKTDVSYRTIQRLTTLKNHLLNFQEEKKYKITFESIDLNFNDQFVSYLINDKKLINNTISKTVSNLKVFLNWASLRKFNKNTDYKEFKCKWNETDLIALSNDELMNLFQHDFSANVSHAKVRDVFCFGCFTGARYSDIEALRFTDIQNGIWQLRMQKTKDVVNIPLNDFALNIVDRYRAAGKLPVISNQKMNDYLKDVCKEAKIETPVKRVKYKGAERIEEISPKYSLIGTHTARRTFVTLSLEKGMRPEIVMKITGHTSMKMLQKYIKITENVQEVELRRAWGNPSKLKLIEKDLPG